MKCVLFFFFLINSLTAFEYGLSPVKLQDKVYCFFGKAEVINTKNNGNMVNTCYVDAGDSWIVIDSGPTYAYAKEAYTKISKIKKQAVSYVINTHVHDDHWLGNSFYHTLGAKSIGSKAFDELSSSKKTRMQKNISAKAFALTSIEFPQRRLSKSEHIQVGNMNIELILLDYKAHTSADIIVYIPSLKAAFAGDLVFNDRLPSLRDGNINGSLKVLDKLKNMQLQTLVGGHGLKHDNEAWKMSYDYCNELRKKLKLAFLEERDIAEAVENISMPSYKNINMYSVLHKQNVETSYRILEWEN
ncbi:MBL fold metallo-hydrolase [Sulfurimonas sp. MAG313]|nr:MBL fold metallo-hydrolase [Sulfurimonas sp. MAG313]MDF1880547.1 MBL fold metallo-hydrolase [Sulfurimonas sp. MAG313]